MLPPVRLAYHMMSSPLGPLFLARTAKGLRYCEFMDRKSLKRMMASHADQCLDARWEPSLLELKGVADQLDEYFNGELQVFDLPLDPVGSEFQLKVWKELLAIPFGATSSYGQIAKAIRQPKASRAVGMANNQNPLVIIVPCHRIVGANGTLTGYGGGLPRKKWLLQHESTHKARTDQLPDLFTSSRRGSR
jgi:O-6-methylguanine DNA methyltransferase